MNIQSPLKTSETKIANYLPSFLGNRWVKITIIIIFVCLLFLFAYYIYRQYSDKNKYTPNKINTLSNDKENMQGNGKTVELMLFYTTWCPHCRSCKPSWDEIKEKYTGRLINGYNVEFVEIDCTNENSKTEKLMNDYKVEGYPTIILVKDEQPINFDAQPSVETLDQFLNSVL